MEAHAGADHDVAVVAQTHDLVAAGPARREADAHEIAAMMPPVVREAGAVDHALPGGVDLAGEDAIPERCHHGVEGRLGYHGHLARFLRDMADMDQPAQRDRKSVV